MRRSPPFAWVRSLFWSAKNGPRLFQLIKSQQKTIALLEQRIQSLEKQVQTQKEWNDYLLQWQNRLTETVRNGQCQRSSAAKGVVTPWRRN